VNELAGVKLDRDINVVAFTDGRQIPLPPGTGYVDENGTVSLPNWRRGLNNRCYKIPSLSNLLRDLVGMHMVAFL